MVNYLRTKCSSLRTQKASIFTFEARTYKEIDANTLAVKFWRLHFEGFEHTVERFKFEQAKASALASPFVTGDAG